MMPYPMPKPDDTHEKIHHSSLVMLEQIQNNSIKEVMNIKHECNDQEIWGKCDLKWKSSRIANTDTEKRQDPDCDLKLTSNSESKQGCFSMSNSFDWPETDVTDLDSKLVCQMNVDLNRYLHLIECNSRVRVTMPSSKIRSEEAISSNTCTELKSTGLSSNKSGQNIQTTLGSDCSSEIETVCENINAGINQVIHKSEDFHNKKSLESKVFSNDDHKEHDLKLKSETPNVTRMSTRISKSKSTKSKTNESRYERKTLISTNTIHDHSIPPPQNLFCNICSRWFKSLINMKKHDCSINMKHICEVCGKGFKFQLWLENHLKVHFNIRDFRCYICEKTFTTLQILTQHLSSHTLPRSHMCKVCGHGFKQSSELRYHSLVHANKKRTVFKDIKPENAENFISFVGRESSSTGPKVKRKQNDKKIKVKEENVTSDLTKDNDGSITRAGTVKHAENAVNIQSVKKENCNEYVLHYLCNLCPKTFSTKRAHEKHTQCHERKTFVFKCRICRKVFEKQSALRHHIMSHNRPFKCNLCGACFDRKDIAKKHLRTHSDIRLYQCSLCDQKFKTKDNWKRHVKNIHEGKTDVQTKPRPFSCRLCRKTFLHAHHVDRHMKIHTKEKPYHCQNCDRCFTERHHLSRHQLVHKTLMSKV